MMLALFLASLLAVPALEAKNRRGDNRYGGGDSWGRYQNQGRGYAYGRDPQWHRDKWRAKAERDYWRDQARRQREYDRGRQRYYRDRYDDRYRYNNNGYYNNRYYDNRYYPGAGYNYSPNGYYGSYPGSYWNSIGGVLGMFLR